MVQNIRWRTVSPVIRMIARLSQYGQERFKPKRKGKRENRGTRNIMLTVGSHGRRFYPEAMILRINSRIFVGKPPSEKCKCLINAVSLAPLGTG